MSAHFDPTMPGDDVLAFVTERHLATLTTIGPNGVQVTPVGFTYEPEARCARVITWAASRKARNVEAQPGQRVAICQVDGGRWLTFYGTAVLSATEASVAQGVERYAARYRQPKERTDRVVIEVTVDDIVGRA